MPLLPRAFQLPQKKVRFPSYLSRQPVVWPVPTTSCLNWTHFPSSLTFLPGSSTTVPGSPAGFMHLSVFCEILCPVYHKPGSSLHSGFSVSGRLGPVYINLLKIYHICMIYFLRREGINLPCAGRSRKERQLRTKFQLLPLRSTVCAQQRVKEKVSGFSPEHSPSFFTPTGTFSLGECGK